jgi:hypothetical protein
MLPQNEYLEIKEFLRHRVCEINRSENEDREKQREGNTEYSLPNANGFGWMPAKTICYSLDIGNKQIMYVIPYLPFYHYLTKFLPQALYNCPDLFGTNNAQDVIDALYSVSGYNKIGDIKEYQQYLIDNACCYFLLRDSDDKLCNKVFRLDLFRHILPNDKNGYDFDGGLMHAYRHCSWNSMKLSSGRGESEMNDLWDLPLIIGKAILIDKNSHTKSFTIITVDGRTWHIHYHIDPDTKVYYLKTAFAK